MSVEFEGDGVPNLFKLEFEIVDQCWSVAEASLHLSCCQELLQDDWITKLHNRNLLLVCVHFVCATSNLVHVQSLPASHLIGSGLCSGHHRNAERYKSCAIWLGGVSCSGSISHWDGRADLVPVHAWSLFSNKSRRIQKGLHSSWSIHPAWSACRWCRSYWC